MLFKNLALQLLKKGLYALIGVLLTFLTQAISGYKPADPTDLMLWTAIWVPILTGLVAVLKRVLTWDPNKAL